jgi:hypothetical protein
LMRMLGSVRGAARASQGEGLSLPRYVAPCEGLSIGIRNGTSRSGRCEDLTKMELKF